jgi:putative tryptophan/tyrosine transport system substrate-binding protein
VAAQHRHPALLKREDRPLAAWYRSFRSAALAQEGHMPIIIRRRELIAALYGAIASPLAGRAQQPQRMRRIGMLMGVADDSEQRARLSVFRQSLQGLGWTEGLNLGIDYRWAPKDAAQARAFAKELVDLRPDVIFTLTTPATVAAKEVVAGSIPIIFVQVGDPVVSKVVESLARPGGNLTGFTSFEPSMGGKWLDPLKTVSPGITRVIYPYNPATLPAFFPQSVEAAAPALSLRVVAAQVRSPAELNLAIEIFAHEPNGALLVMPDVFNAANREQLFALAARYRLPALYPFKYFAVEGGMLSYGINVPEVFRQAASYVDRVLRGTNPRDLPVQIPTKLELVINLKTAKALGLQIPDKLLALADEAIE